MPPPLRSVNDTGVSAPLLQELLLKIMYFGSGGGTAGGPAVRSGRSLFLFGGPGNGKPSIAERIANLIGDPIFVPHAIESEGEIIKVYDPLYHTALETDSGKVDERDRRWVVVKRPFVV